LKVKSSASPFNLAGSNGFKNYYKKFNSLFIIVFVNKKRQVLQIVKPLTADYKSKEYIDVRH